MNKRFPTTNDSQLALLPLSLQQLGIDNSPFITDDGASRCTNLRKLRLVTPSLVTGTCLSKLPRLDELVLASESAEFLVAALQALMLNKRAVQQLLACPHNLTDAGLEEFERLGGRDLIMQALALHGQDLYSAINLVQPFMKEMPLFDCSVPLVKALVAHCCVDSHAIQDMNTSELAVVAAMEQLWDALDCRRRWAPDVLQALHLLSSQPTGSILLANARCVAALAQVECPHRSVNAPAILSSLLFNQRHNAAFLSEIAASDSGLAALSRAVNESIEVTNTTQYCEFVCANVCHVITSPAHRSSFACKGGMFNVLTVLCYCARTSRFTVAPWVALLLILPTTDDVEMERFVDADGLHALISFKQLALRHYTSRMDPALLYEQFATFGEDYDVSFGAVQDASARMHAWCVTQEEECRLSWELNNPLALR
jgi:hypothetical protein